MSEDRNQHTAGSSVAAGGVTAAAPASTRDRYFDLLRAAAIVRVVVYHMFPVAWLSMVFPSMGVMFALGGSLMAASMSRSTEQAITGRLRRLLPALWVMGAVLVPVMLLRGWPDRPEPSALLLWVLPIAEPPAAEWAEPAVGVLWYLVTYLWLVLASPLLLRCYRKARLIAVATPLVALAGMEEMSVSLGETADSVLTDGLTFATCWMLGFAHRDGDLRRVPSPLLVAVAAVCTATGLGWVITHPTEDGIDLGSIPLAYGLYSAGFVLVLLRFTPPMGWLTRRQRIGKAVNLLNARAVTIYLWHNAAIAVSFPLGDKLEVWRIPEPFMMLGYAGVALGLLVAAVAVLGWVEDVAARRRIRLLPVQPAVSRPRRVTPAWSGPMP